MFASSESASVWFNIWTGVGIFGAILVAVGGLLTWRAGIAKDAFADARSRQAEVRISENEAKSKQAAVELQTQKKLTAEATAATEREKIERLKLEAQLAPRRIAQDQVETLKHALKPSGIALIIASRMFDGESKDYAEELNSAMHAAGWTNTGRAPMWATSDAGVFVATTEKTQGPEINMVATALQKAGVPAQVLVLKPDQIGTIPDHFQDHILYILVGRQPPPATSSSR